MGLIDRLAPGPVALDTSIFIYWIEEDTDYLAHLEPLFRAVDEGGILAVTSALTLLEVLVVPYRGGDLDLVARYEAVLTRSRGLSLVPLDAALLRTAAELRARTAVKTPDALQLSAALHAGCTAFLTNDRRLPSLPRLPIYQLSEFVSK